MQNPFPVIVWRDSVCAGDDCDAPHEWKLDAPGNMTLRAFLDACLARRYLASISGGEATWVLESTRPLAVLAQQWAGPRFLAAPESPLLSLVDPAANPHLNFRYRRQADPDQVFESLSRGGPSADS